MLKFRRPDATCVLAAVRWGLERVQDYSSSVNPFWRINIGFYATKRNLVAAMRESCAGRMIIALLKQLLYLEKNPGFNGELRSLIASWLQNVLVRGHRNGIAKVMGLISVEARFFSGHIGNCLSCFTTAMIAIIAVFHVSRFQNVIYLIIFSEKSGLISQTYCRAMQLRGGLVWLHSRKRRLSLAASFRTNSKCRNWADIWSFYVLFKR